MTTPYGDPQQQPGPPPPPPPPGQQPGSYPAYPGGQYAPPPGYGYGVPQVTTPATVTGAAVIAYIVSGLLFIFALLLFAAGSALSDSVFGNLGAAVAIVGVIFLGLGALYIAGGVQLQKGKNRVFLITVAAILGGLMLISFLSSLGDINNAGSVIFPLILIGAQAVIIALCAQPATAQYIQARRSSGF